MKYLLSLCFVLVLSPLANAQNCSIGLKGGAVWANQDYRLDGGSGLDSDYLLGTYLGLNSELFRGSHFSLLVDLGYIRKGRTNEITFNIPSDPEGGETRTAETYLDFITFTPSLKYRYPFGDIAVSAFLGPRLDHFLSYSSNESPILFESAFARQFVFGWDAGLGAEYSLSPFLVFAHFTYQADISKFVDEEATANSVSIKAKNRAFIAAVGFRVFL